MNNGGPLTTYAERAARLDDARWEAAEDLKELWKEAKSAGLSSDELAGIKQGLRERHWDEEKHAKAREARRVADLLRDELPLFGAAA